ncbi:hypothetical protein JR316_0002512 [Psilocybe cubensis]|uniref:Uncharacterized protein n=2 Tax=Psilocybe cubensis TaxID=181762 RepID=A0A8H7Y8E4_PSICU|nr:hypothetical protein JR316_0002512 [Psilocybe cubensis]KAH9485602.1 hypothetical protein JR316_0002512 [Psilocybe cubensis]
MDPFASYLRRSAEGTKRPRSSDRSALGSLPQGWVNTQSNQDSPQHDSPLHASAEALLLLNNPHFHHEKSAEPYLFSEEKENANNQFGGIPITAPVPLSYAVRGKAALRSILSIGEDDDEDGINGDSVPQMLNDSVPSSFPHIEITAPTPSPILPIVPLFNIPEDTALIRNQPWPEVIGGPATRPFVRSISPSTLMALSEPCLLAWCFDPNLDFSANPAENSVGVQQVYNYPIAEAVYEVPISTDCMIPATPRNVWGY